MSFVILAIFGIVLAPCCLLLSLTMPQNGILLFFLQIIIILYYANALPDNAIFISRQPRS